MSEIKIIEATDAAVWDSALCSMPGAHPLQSWAWGEAKREVGEPPLRLMALREDQPVGLAQCFIKHVTPFKIPIAWISRGPAAVSDEVAHIVSLLRGELAARGARATVIQPPVGRPLFNGWRLPGAASATFVIDLSRSIDELDANLHVKWRYNKNRFLRRGGVVLETTDETHLEELIAKYAELQARKGFAGYGSSDLIRSVWKNFRSSTNPRLSVHLFRASLEDQHLASTLVARIGESAHEMWAVFDFDKQLARASEAVRWASMQVLKDLGVLHFDLEGADRKGNPGVYRFKQHMGGTLVELPKPRILPTVFG
jgi:lipid II:glycine glycyltransferase (peptidoglycan interpeptide bridge formation enzyme)